MEIFDRAFSFIREGNLITFFTKLFGIVFGGLYLFFTLILVQQVVTLKKVVKINDGGLLLLVAQVQFILAIAILLYAIIIL